MNRHDVKVLAMLRVARELSRLSTCPRADSGAVITTPDFHVLSTGYNGAPTGLPHCVDEGCLMVNEHCARVLHAESNAVLNAVKLGIGLRHSYMFCTHFPCPSCAKMIVQVGVRALWYSERVVGSYNDDDRGLTEAFFEAARIQFKQEDGSHGD